MTIAVGQSTKTFTVAASSFQHFAVGTTVEAGTLTATVEDVDGHGGNYDLGTDVRGRCGHRHRRDGPDRGGVLHRGGGSRDPLGQADRAHRPGRAAAECLERAAST